MAPAISARRLAVTFARRGRQEAVLALQPFDLELERGRILGVLGPNGAGKPPVLGVLAGLRPPTAGAVSVLDLPPTHAALQRRVAFQPEGPLPLDVLTAREYLAYTGAALGLPNADSDARAATWLERLDLLHTGRRWIRTFSTGMQRRLALAAALLGDPEVLLLDEPTAGLDPFGSAAVMAILRERAAAGTAVLMASHQLHEVEEICDELILLQIDAVRARGALADLLGTDDRSLQVRGLDDAGMARLADAARQLGGEVLSVERPRQHLFALFRRYAAGRGPDGAP